MRISTNYRHGLHVRDESLLQAYDIGVVEGKQGSETSVLKDDLLRNCKRRTGLESRAVLRELMLNERIV